MSINVLETVDNPTDVEPGLLALSLNSPTHGISATSNNAVDISAGLQSLGFSELPATISSNVVARPGLESLPLSQLTPSITATNQQNADPIDANSESLTLNEINVTVESATGNVVNAASASRTDVLAAISSASLGDAVVVPAGNVSWAGDIDISGINLQGPGKDAGSPLVVTAGAVNMTKHSTTETRLSGIRFPGNNLHVTVDGSIDNEIFQIYDCYFYSGGATWADMTTNGGIWWGNEMEANVGHISDSFKINLGGPGGQGLTSWQRATTMGTDDTDGKTNTYFEDNVWTWFGEVTYDCDNGGRVVQRHDVYNDSSMVYHGGGSGTSGQDTSSYGGRHLEIYDCTFNRTSSEVNASINKWVWLRGGGGFVFTDNAVDDSDNIHYSGKQNVRLSCGCPGSPSYPMLYQVGQNSQTPDPTPDQPALIFNNTGSAVSAGLIDISGQSGGGISCGNPAFYIQQGRDYETSNTWGWSKYPYPHPLRADQ